jgi:pentatricopeptide repeat protein
MGTLEWHLAETLLLDLSQQAQGDHQKLLETSWEILQRLAEETAAIENSTDSSKPKMDIYLLHAVLKHWNDSFRKNRSRWLPSQICQKVDSLVESSNHRLLEPNIATYTIIMDGATACPDPQERLVFTENLLSRLIQDSAQNPSLQPTAVTFGTVIHALTKSNSAALAEKAENLLRRMQQLHQEEGWSSVEPNAVVYTSVIQAWANAGRADRAEALLQEMYREAMLNGKEAVQPNTRTFNAVLLAWSKSLDPDRVASAEVLLHKMMDRNSNSSSSMSIAPDLVSFHLLLTTIASAARSRGGGRNHPDELWVKAEYWMEQLFLLKNSLSPSTYTYKTLFRILASRDHVPDKAERARFWLNQCGDDNVRRDPVLRKLIEEMEHNS